MCAIFFELCDLTDVPKSKVSDHRNTRIASVSVNKSDVFWRPGTKVKPNHSQYTHRLYFSVRNSTHHVTAKRKTVDKHREHAKGLRLCFSCLHGGHLPSSCTNKQKCRVCDGFHTLSF